MPPSSALSPASPDVIVAAMANRPIWKEFIWLQNVVSLIQHASFTRARCEAQRLEHLHGSARNPWRDGRQPIRWGAWGVIRRHSRQDNPHKEDFNLEVGPVHSSECPGELPQPRNRLVAPRRPDLPHTRCRTRDRAAPRLLSLVSNVWRRLAAQSPVPMRRLRTWRRPPLGRPKPSHRNLATAAASRARPAAARISGRTKSPGAHGAQGGRVPEGHRGVRCFVPLVG